MKATVRFVVLAALIGGLAVWRMTAISPNPVDVLSAESGPALAFEESGRAAAADDLVRPSHDRVEGVVEPGPEPMATTAPPDSEGMGVIQGHVRFLNGAPFPELSVTCQAVDKAAGPGRLWNVTETSVDGSFEMTSLAPGGFRFQVSRGDELLVTGIDVFHVGDTGIEFAVDATLLNVSCVNDDGEMVTISKLDVSSVQVGEPGLGPRPKRHREARGKDSFELLVIPSLSYLIRAQGEDGMFYFAYLEGTLSVGVQQLALRPNPTNLSRLVLSTSPGALAEGTNLRLQWLNRDGVYLSADSYAVKEKPRTGAVEVRGLAPGHYSANVVLVNSEWELLVEPLHHFVLAAGDVKQIDLEIREGGRIELSLSGLGSSGDLDKAGPIRVRLIGDQEWSIIDFQSGHEGATMTGPAVRLDGTLARSAVLDPGKYEVEIEARGYLTAQADVMVRARVAAPLEISLLPE